MTLPSLAPCHADSPGRCMVQGMEASFKSFALGLHPLHHATQIHPDVARNAGFGHNVAHRAGYTLKIFRIRGHIDVDGSLNLVMVDFGWRHDLLNIYNVVEDGGRPALPAAGP